MPRSVCWLRYVCASALAFPTLAVAQDSPLFSYATYFECDPGREARADALMRESFFPIFDQNVAAKRLTGYGWMAHNLGGHWRRVGFMVAPSLDAVFDGQGAVLKDMRARGKAFAEFTSICPRHEDYIWRRLVSSRSGETTAPVRPTARVAVYYECNPARTSRADSLVTQAFAPIWSRYLTPDGMRAWSWHRHVMGGKYSRLLLLDGANHKAILAAIGSILGDIGQQKSSESTEFSEICQSHEDYLWDIQAMKP